MNDDRDEKFEIVYEKIEHHTEKAWLFIFGDKKVWLPMSQCDLDNGNKIVHVPTWLIEEKHLESYIV